MNYIDSVVFVLDQPQQRNFTQWPILNEYVWPNNYVGGSYANEVHYLKQWITSRLSWLDTNIASLEVITELDDTPIEATPITIFPNPNNGQFNVRIETFSNSEISINLYDQLGKVILNKRLNINSLKDNTLSILEPSNALKKGMYILEISDDKHHVYTEKMIVN